MNFTPNQPKQQLVFDCKKRFILAMAGKQGGKTTVGAAWFLREIYSNYLARVAKGDATPRQWLICGPSHKNLNQGALPKFKEFFPSDWGEWKEQKSCFDLVWGDTIFVRSADDPDDIESMTLSGAWLDEFGRMDKSVWENIQARVMRYQARVVMTTTPYLRQFWLKSDVYDRACEMNGQPTNKDDTDPEIVVIKWKTSENPAISKDDLERQRRLLSPEAYELAYEAEFTKPQGLVYRDFDHEGDVLTPFSIPETWERFGGLDFGFGSITCLLCVAKKPEVRDDKGAIKEPAVFYVFREVYEKGMLLPQLARHIMANNLRYILYDPRGAQESAELSSAVFGVKGLKAADNGIEAGVDRLKVLFMEHRVKVFKNCKNFIAEILGYYNDEDGIPVKKNDHAMDALKYAFSRQMEGMFKENPRSVRYQYRTTLVPRVTRGDVMNDANSLTGY